MVAHRVFVVVVFGVVVPIRIVGLALSLKLVEVRVVVRERKLGGFRESGGVFFGGNFGGVVGVGHGRKLVDFETIARKKLTDFQVFNLVRCNGIDIAAVWVAVDDDERAVESVAVGDASSQIHSAIGEFNKGINARAGGGSRVGHVRKLSQFARNATKKIVFYEKKSFTKLHFFLDSYGWRRGRAP